MGIGHPSLVFLLAMDPYAPRLRKGSPGSTVLSQLFSQPQWLCGCKPQGRDWARKALAIQTKPESGFNKCTFQEIDLDDHE